jgi:RES domain-containing protein
MLGRARWHSKGRPIVYCAANPATALLEILVHFEADLDEVPDTLPFHEIEAPDDVAVADEALDTDEKISRARGDAWLASARTPLLRVPSVLAPATFNFLINPVHVDAGRIRIVRTHRHPFDRRLFKTATPIK